MKDCCDVTVEQALWNLNYGNSKLQFCIIPWGSELWISLGV